MWKVGQTVWCVLRGKGRVERLDDGAPVCSFSGSFGLIAYNKQGAIGLQFNRSLFFSEPKVVGATKPPFVPSLNKGDKIVAICKEDDEALRWIVERETETYVDAKGTLTGVRVTLRKEEYIMYKIGEPIY